MVAQSHSGRSAAHHPRDNRTGSGPRRRMSLRTAWGRLKFLNERFEDSLPGKVITTFLLIAIPYAIFVIGGCLT